MTKKRRRKREHTPVEGWELEHSPLTPMGQVESYGRFARGAFRARGWRGFTARLMVWGMLIGFAVGLVIGLINLVKGLR